MVEKQKEATDTAHTKLLQKKYPVLWDSLVEAKTCAIGGWLPSAGGLDDQTGGLKETLEWLAEACMLEYVHRSAPSMGL